MTKGIIIECNHCTRTITSKEHAGTWFTLKRGNVFEQDAKRIVEDQHFCSLYCLIIFSFSAYKENNLHPVVNDLLRTLSMLHLTQPPY